MWDIKVDDAGSITFDSGEIAIVEDEDAIAQSIKLAILTWKYTHIDNPNFGINWRYIFTNPYGLPIKEVVEMEVNALMSSGFHPDIEKFSFIEVEMEGRELKISGTVVLKNGKTLELAEIVKI